MVELWFMSSGLNKAVHVGTADRLGKHLRVVFRFLDMSGVSQQESSRNSLLDPCQARRSGSSITELPLRLEYRTVNTFAYTGNAQSLVSPNQAGMLAFFG